MTRKERNAAAAVWNEKADDWARQASNWKKVARRWKTSNEEMDKDVRREARRRAKEAQENETRCRTAARSWAC